MLLSAGKDYANCLSLRRGHLNVLFFPEPKALPDPANEHPVTLSGICDHWEREVFVFSSTAMFSSSHTRTGFHTWFHLLTRQWYMPAVFVVSTGGFSWWQPLQPPWEKPTPKENPHVCRHLESGR